MSHRPVLIPLILAAMLIAGSWVGRGRIASTPGLPAASATEVADNLARPQVPEQIQLGLGLW